MKFPVGITLLFYKRKRRASTAYLRSFVVEVSSLSNLKSTALKIGKRNPEQTFVGIEDVFFVSGPIREGEVLGKSYIEEITSPEETKKLLLKRKSYSFHFQTIRATTGKKWYLVSMIYFYNNKKASDKLAISCLTPVLAKNLSEVDAKIKAICQNISFLKKVLPFTIDRMEFTNLTYIGIEDVTLIKKSLLNNGCFEESFNDYKNLHELKGILPDKNYIEKTGKKVLRDTARFNKNISNTGTKRFKM